MTYYDGGPRMAGWSGSGVIVNLYHNELNRVADLKLQKNYSIMYYCQQ